MVKGTPDLSQVSHVPVLSISFLNEFSTSLCKSMGKETADLQFEATDEKGEFGGRFRRDEDFME